MEKTETRLISIADAARLAGVSYLTIWRATRRGELPVYKIGEQTGPLRIDRRELTEWIYGDPEGAA